MEHTMLGPGFAVEIKSVDLSEEQTPEAVNAMRDLWLQHKVAVFREQNLEDEDLRSLVRTRSAAKGPTMPIRTKVGWTG